MIEAGTNDVIHIHNPSANAISEMANLATYEGARVILTTIPATSIPQYDVPANNDFWAVVTKASTGVPDPATLGLLSLGLTGMGLVRRRRTR